MSYIVPNVPTITSPVLLDKEIQELQTKLAEITWLDYSFARAIKQKMNTSDSGLVNFPEVFQGNGLDFYNCLPNDNLKSYCFFYADSYENVVYLSRKNSKVLEREVSLIFFFNLTKINPAKTYIFTEELKSDVLDVLIMNLKGQVTKYYDTIDDCFSFFTTDYIKSQYYEKKYGAMRFDMTMKYNNTCT